MKRFRAALLAAAALFPLHSVPLYASDTVKLNLTVTGMDFSEEDVVLRITDLTGGDVHEEVLAEEKSVIEIGRGREYLLSLKDCPPGLIPDTEIFVTKQQSQSELTKVFRLKPFSVHIFQYVENTTLFAEGGRLELRDESDEAVLLFSPREDGRVMKEKEAQSEENEEQEEEEEFAFEAGKSYILSQKEKAETYADTGECLIMIPEYLENPDKPLEFRFYVRELPETGGEEEPEPAPETPWYEYVPAPLIVPVYEERKEEKEEPVSSETGKEEKETETVKETLFAQSSQNFVIPEIYLPGTEEKKTSKKIETKAEKAGFRVRFLNEAGNYLPGAKLAVYDKDSRIVDEWESGMEDHLVSGDNIKAGETYTIHLLRAAEGYAASVLDIEHTVTARTDDSFPVIELSDRPKKTILPQLNRTEEKTDGTVHEKAEKKPLSWALIASVLAALGIGGTVGAVMLVSRKES